MWDPVLRPMPARPAVLAVLPGHGRDPWYPPTDTLDGAVEAIAAGLPSDKVFLVGYSMGARVALAVALAHPDKVLGAVLVGVDPGIPSETERKVRAAWDDAEAVRVERDGLERYAAHWGSLPIFETQRRLPEILRRQRAIQRMEHTPKGIAWAMRTLGTGRMPSQWPALARTTVPLCFVAGALDEKFMALAERAACVAPHGERQVVDGAGHDVALENPDALAAIVQDFTHRHTRGASQAMTDVQWTRADGYEDILYEKSGDGIARITINRPEVHNAFRPLTVAEMGRAFTDARDDATVGVVILTGAGTEAFCSGGDQRVRGHGGYVGADGIARLNVLDLQRQIRTIPKPVVAMVAGYAIGGGHVLHMMCDLTIAADNARFGQTGPRVGSFDGGYGASYMARIVGQKKAREIWFLCRQYDASQALAMGLVNTVVPLADLERETVAWCREILANSPTALRFLKAALNADCDGQAGLQELAGSATLLFYQTEEGREGRDAFLEKRVPDFNKFPRLP